ncbi:MAG: TetR/AcrR family transcriptional regulator, partial [Thermostichus sp. BF3_bins_97]
RHGYARTSMDRVAIAAKVSKQTLYSYFQDKEGLFLALVQQMASQRFQQVFGDLPLQGDPELVLRQLASTFLARIQADQEYLNFIRLLVAESGHFPKLGQTFIQTVTQPAHQRLSQFLRAHPNLKIRDPDSVAWVFLGSLIALLFAQRLLYAEDLLPLDNQRLVETLIALILPQIVPHNDSPEPSRQNPAGN